MTATSNKEELCLWHTVSHSVGRTDPATWRHPLDAPLTNFLFEDRQCSAQYLRQVLQRRRPHRVQMLADMFAMGCLLHFQGERSAASTLIGQVFDAVRDVDELDYLTALLNNISGNELRFAAEVEPSFELKELCDRAGRGPYREAACAR